MLANNMSSIRGVQERYSTLFMLSGYKRRKQYNWGAYLVFE